MDASQLSRHLLYYGYDDVADHLKKSPLNRHLYKVLIELLPKSQIKVPFLTLFNEIYYQCAHVNFDGSPGVDIEQRYLAEEEAVLQSKKAAYLVFSIVFGLLSDKPHSTFEENCFLRALAPYIQGCEYEQLALSIPQDLRYQGIAIPEVFPTLTCPIIGLPRFLKDEANRALCWALIEADELDVGKYEKELRKVEEFCVSWAGVTGNYSHIVIEKLLHLYEKPEDQLSLLRIIDASCSDSISAKLSYYFMQLENRIREGGFQPETIPSTEPVVLFAEDNCQHPYAEKHESQQFVEHEQKTVEHDEIAFKLTEMVDYVKKKFSKSAASEFSTMCYSMIVKSNKTIDDETAELLDGIDVAIISRDANHQAFYLPNVQQFNNNPQKVINNTSEEGKG